MRLSIIVPVYNVKNFLPACLDTLVQQTVRDYELILVDDGATDGSGELCEEYAKRYPALIRTKHIDNGGQGRARNFGIDMAQGDYLGFVDSDDWVELSMYEKLLARAEATGADVVVCDFLSKYADGREEYLPACVQEHPLASAGSSCNKIFRRSAVAELRFPTGLWYEDFYFSAMMLLRSKRTEFIAEPLYVYRRGQESTMHNKNAAKNLDILTIMDKLAEAMLPQGQRDGYEFFIVNHVVLDTISRLAEQRTDEAEAVIRQMRRYAKKAVPQLTRSAAFRRESPKRRIIMFLNYHGRHRLAQLILQANRKIR